MQINPWSGQFTAQLNAVNNRHRLKQLKRFLGVQTLVGVQCLDIGAPNFLSKEMEIKDNTRGDLNFNVKAPNTEYNMVTFLEVLNHLQNQLFVMLEIHKLLKPNGKLILSTPRPGIFNYSHGVGNYVEIKERNVLKLLEYCGFRILRKKVYRSYPFRYVFMGFLQPWRWFFPFKGDTIHHPGAPKAKWYFFGIRPILKWWLHKYILIEAEKI